MDLVHRTTVTAPVDALDALMAEAVRGGIPLSTVMAKALVVLFGGIGGRRVVLGDTWTPG